MPGKPQKLGPFSAGMNNAGDVTTIPDNAVSVATNFDFDIDGFLIGRPAIVTEFASPVTGENVNGLGYYVRFDGETFLVATTNSLTWIYQLSTQVWTQIWTSPASSFVQYDNKVVMISPTVVGGYWEAGVFTSTPTMPLGQQITFYQERFWAFGAKGTSNATTIWLSDINVITPADSIYTWQPSINFFTVGKGDGQWVTGMLADTSSLIIFRNRSTYQFTFPSTPLQGTLRVLSATIGTDNQFTFGRYQDFYLVLSQGFLYQFINYRFYPLNTKLIKLGGAQLTGGQLYDLRLSIFGARVIIWFQGALWVYNIVQNTWSQWSSPTTSAGMFWQIPPAALTGGARQALVTCGENTSSKWKLYRISEDPLPASSPGESITAHVRTKAYTLDEPAQYKRLFMWTVQAETASGLTGVATPIAQPTSFTTWDQMALSDWDTLAKGSWDNPLLTVVQITDNIAWPTSAPVLIETKLIQGLRFLSIFFDVTLVFDGTTKTSPAKIYAITPYMLIKRGLMKVVT